MNNYTSPIQLSSVYDNNLNHNIPLEFINRAATAAYPVLQLEAGYGEVSLQALGAGANVIVADSNYINLEVIKASTISKHQNRLQCIYQDIRELEIQSESLEAVFMSHVLMKLTPSEILKLVDKIYDWLIPGGSVYLVAASPFRGFCKSYLPTYYHKTELGIPFAGYMKDLDLYVNENYLLEKNYSFLNHLDTSDLTRLFGSFFTIDQMQYLSGQKMALSKEVLLDGKESIGLIATK